MVNNLSFLGFRLSPYFFTASALHHGAPGSFKTFTLVQRRAIDALSAGRVVVSNIRGFESFDKVIAAFPEIEFPDSAGLIYVDTENSHNRKMMALWFLWVPAGAVILIDEVQRIYRSKDKVQDLTVSNHPDIYRDDLGGEKKRPDNFYDAFDMQRHFGWDVFMSSTNIAKVRPEIREVCEWAYRHRNISGVLPWKKNSWYEHQHDPEQSGKIASHRVGEPVEYKADPRIFACYQSTATGDHIKSTAGRSIFSDPKIMGTFAASGLLIIVCISLFFFDTSEKPVVKSVSMASQQPVKAVLKNSQQSAVKSSANAGNHVNPVKSFKTPVIVAPLANKTVVISGYVSGVQNKYFIRVCGADAVCFEDDTNTMLSLGYLIYRVSDCMFYYVYANEKRLAFCGDSIKNQI